MERRWILADCDPQLASFLVKELQLSPFLAKILIQRKKTDPDQIQKYLHPSFQHLPDPFLFLGMERSVLRLVQAIQEKEKITIYGDYDVDGTTSTALLMTFFREVGAVVDYYIPHRLKEGYSLNTSALQKIRSQGTRVVVTVDNGISAVKEAEVAKELGIDLIITDHHECPEILPAAFSILNPKQKGDSFPGKELAGVGVAFYLLIALRKILREKGMLHQDINLRSYLDLVAVGTISDMAPLINTNRILVSEGLKVLRTHPRLGFKALIEAAGIDRDVTTSHVGFRIGPRINAVGRLEDAALGVRLLLSENLEEARSLAKNLNHSNEERQGLEDQILTEAILKVESQGLPQKFKSLILCDEQWHPGVVGIVASRLVEKYYLPAIVLSQNENLLKGSARAIRNFDLITALRNCSSWLEKFGGHRYAAGLALQSENFKNFQVAFDQEVRRQLSEVDFIPSLQLDLEFDLASIKEQVLQEIQLLEPFGMGNAEPRFLLRQASIKESRIVGQKHLRMKIGDPSGHFQAIGFGLAKKSASIPAKIDLAFIPEWNEWQGNRSIQLRVIDFKVPEMM